LKHLTRRAGLLVAGALLAVPALAGCDQPSAAAQIGAETITQERLAALVDDYNLIFALATGAEATAVDAVLTQAIVDRVAGRLIAETGDQALIDSVNPMTPDQFAAWIEENEVADAATVELVKKMDPDSLSVATNARLAVLEQAVNAGQVTLDQLMAALEQVKVNPRYGEWPTGENARAALEAPDRPWLISLASLGAEDAGQDLNLVPAPEPAG
jgi:hypothetical protein